MNGKSSVLIVDDNPENIRVLGAALERLKCKISIASSGDAAIKMAKKLIPDVILLDVMMPEIDGFQVCKILKTNFRTQDIEIIFVTAAVNPDDELKGLALGAVDYIHKPFSIPIVQAKVALHLERIANKKLREDIEQIIRHDLKTPLNVIIGYSQMMLGYDNLTTEQRRKYLDEILGAGKGMLRMINESLDLFKMETGRYPYMPKPVDIVSVIQKLEKDFHILMAEYVVGIKILLDGQEYNDSQSFTASAEMDLCYTLFGNLIRNAIEACTANDNIVINICYENNDVVVSITNPGTVPESIRDTFFEKYSTAGKFGGTGLGTYSAKLMTETQKGKIAMTTDEEKTCITVKLPAA